MRYSSAEFYLDRLAQSQPEVVPVAGRSGYFSTPDPGLDPDLFDGENLRTEVAAHIREKLYVFWLGRYRNPHSWSRLWLAGSGISHQWAADRGNGDLDVMIGLDPVKFRESNPLYSGLSNRQLADHLNSELKAWLWPQTAHTQFGSKVYEVTYYCVACGSEPGDVRAINPYAAYDLMDLSWTIRPPQLPADPRTLYPRDWWQFIDREADTASRIIERYNNARRRAARMREATPGYVNAVTEMRLAASQAQALFDDIHTRRKEAFAPGGQGYGDFANFRWQAHKANGIVPALAEIAKANRQAVALASTALYGGEIKSADTALTEALLWSRTQGEMS